MLLSSTPSKKIIKVLFNEYMTSHNNALYFFSGETINADGERKKHVTEKDALEYIYTAIDYISYYTFGTSEVYGKGDISLFYSQYNLYQHISISFLSQISKAVFGKEFEEITIMTKRKSELPIMYLNGDNPFEVSKKVYVYTEEKYKIVLDFIVFYVYNLGNISIKDGGD